MQTFTPWQEFVSELLGTFLFLLIALGTVAFVTIFAPGTAASPIGGQIINGGYTNVTLGWGFGLLLGIFLSGTVSGAHLNPAVTLALAATGRHPWRKVPHYMLAQLVGAFLAAALVFADYHTRWLQYDPQLAHTAGVLTSFPGVKDLGFWGSTLDLLVGTAILMISILAIGDRFNNAKGVTWSALGIAFALMAVSTAFGQHSFAVNPARDLGPRLFTALAGFRNTGFSGLVWLPGVVGPFVGALIGAYLYDLTVGRSLKQVNLGATGAQGLDTEYTPVIAASQPAAVPENP